VRKPAVCGVSKNLLLRNQADTDYYGLFDTRAAPIVGVFNLSQKWAIFLCNPRFLDRRHGRVLVPAGTDASFRLAYQPC
jgi:hypothetical protein